MTTAHRPTFDHARGRDNVRSSIKHKRAMPAHMAMKYRREKRPTDDDWDGASEYEVDKSEVQRLRSELEDRSGAESRGAAEERQPEADELERSRQLLLETKDIDSDSDSESEGDSEEDDEEDDDEEDEDAELLRELEKIKREKEARLAKQKEEELARRAASSNPLVQFSDSVHKSWRSTTFRRKEKASRQESYINDMLRSDFHKRFMDRYVK
ncbi:hypothetical protein KL948_000494 [Ogataea haglerorum]|uniref:Pre-mRNA-splicing factor CWC15 n=1 Tax=Ogataea haglerorum TaxID=1937702 RepID=A0ABQ7RN70_9ASCO|nr:uncharacterized protein KL911_001276 [Ogataea haglerorum]KAG7711852.1 hypothetical protein KL914_000494 [Ogataea haglerorum]KAG7734928.1 hypothetical protein KL948_000494 [Ogataea haglerorum]KAG7751304.1 hypothetical protein KL912_000437 [Ogataea haglerorum]KAG7756474.1 hypothetical protein KL911_001276 [Ogataea haglerorum]KAG7768987.1 hypothetical protein KL946_000270 [Ogataea haglerorum]